MAMQLAIQVDGASAGPPDRSRARITMRVDIGDVRSNGDAAISYTITHINLDSYDGDPKLRPSTEAKLGEMLGLHAEGTMSALGVWTASKLSTPAGVSEAARKELERLHDAIGKGSIPLPAQPVGIGARWTAARMSRGEFPLSMNATYQLVADDDRSARVEIEGRGAASQPVTRDGATIEDLHIAMTATTTLHWDRFVSDALMKLDTGLHMAVKNDRGEQKRIEMQLGLGVTFGPPTHAEDSCSQVEIRAAVARGDRLREQLSQRTEANTEYERACRCHDEQGCGYLAFSYLEGVGVATDLKRAADLFEQACGTASPPTTNAAGFCFMLATCYHRGEGRPHDLSAAAALYRRSCNGGWSESCSRLGVFLEDGIGTSPDPADAIAAYIKGCDGGSPRGCLSLSLVYQRGKLGTKRDAARAKQLRIRTCELCAEKKCTGMTDICPAH